MDFIRIVMIIKIIGRRFYLSELFLLAQGDGEILGKTMLVFFLLLCCLFASFIGFLLF